MTAAVISACASIIVAVLAFLLTQRAQRRQELRQARLTRVNSQLRDLYGPLVALVDTNEQIWEELRRTALPAKEHRTPEAATAEWKRWRDQALMPANRKMRDLIQDHADLIDGIDFPEPVRKFCAHVLSLEVATSAEAEGLNQGALVRHPGDAYVKYVRETFSSLKSEQQRLLLTFR